MNKKLLVLLIFIFCGVKFYGQKYKITYSANAITRACLIGGKDYYAISLKDSKTSETFVLAESSCGNRVKHRNKVAYIDFLPDLLTVFKSNENETTRNEYDVFISYCETNASLGNNVFLSIEPVINILSQPVNNTLCDVTLEVDNSGFEPEVYRWQFFDIAINEWSYLPNHLQGKYKISFTLNDWIKEKAKDNYFKSFQFRMENLCKGTYTDIVTFVFSLCSPNLKIIKPTKTICNYSSDGSFIMTVDRDLITDEKMVVTLYKENMLNGEYDILVGQEESTKTLNKVSLKEYKWPNNLDAGNYKIKYQVLAKNINIESDDSSWANLELSDVPFTVGKPKPIEFSVSNEKHESCYNSQDGNFQLNVSGEKARSYLYKRYMINSDDSTTEVLVSWIPFGETSIKLLGLGKGKYGIKVKDNKGCLAK